VLESEAGGCCNIKWQILSNPIGDPMHNVSLNLIQRYFSGLFSTLFVLYFLCFCFPLLHVVIPLVVLI
jgi:hypothetical protein